MFKLTGAEPVMANVMPWSFRNSEVDGRPAQILIDDRFQASAPVRELPKLAWFGVYCQSDPGNAFWHPDESDTLDRLENELIELWEQLGQGWAVYVLRIATRGLREIMFTLPKRPILLRCCRG